MSWSERVELSVAQGQPSRLRIVVEAVLPQGEGFDLIIEAVGQLAKLKARARSLEQIALVPMHPEAYGQIVRRRGWSPEARHAKSEQMKEYWRRKRAGQATTEGYEV